MQHYISNQRFISMSDAIPQAIPMTKLVPVDSLLRGHHPPYVWLIHKLIHEYTSLVPKPPPFFVVFFCLFLVFKFAFSIIHTHNICIILNTNRRTQNGGGLGTRLRVHRMNNFVVISFPGPLHSILSLMKRA